MHGLGNRSDQRLLIIANRLPVSVAVQDNGQVETKVASGGLVSGLQALSKSIQFRWFGWPGIDIHKNDRANVEAELWSRFNATPVFLSRDVAEDHYNGFSNSVLWPLLHGVPAKARFKESCCEAYKMVNAHFADVVAPHVKDGDRIWVHVYHLLLLPQLLRDRLKGHTFRNVRIGFFLHTPFPSEDAFAILPLHQTICDSLLSCDLVGFHTRKYIEAFLNAAEKALPVTRTPRGLHYRDGNLVAQDIPIGIDIDEFRTSLASDTTQAQIATLRRSFREKKVVLGADRFDYIKGIPQKLHAYNKMLGDHPEWIGKVELIQVCVPTRSTVAEYISLRREVEGLVGKINGTHGTPTWTPVRYLHRSLDKPTLHALYATADVCIVSSVRDGLNLVSYEYVACQVSRRGVLMLSQDTGAAEMLVSAVMINPWDTPRFALAILQALTMSRKERKMRLYEASEVVNYWTSTRWGMSFLEKLQSNNIENI